MKRPTLLFPFFFVPAALLAQDAGVVPAINQLGLDLYRIESAKAPAPANLLLSPSSISTALAMTYAGADGATREEMRRVLHFTAADDAIYDDFAAFAQELKAIHERSREAARRDAEHGEGGTPVELSTANRLFVQQGYPLRDAFVALLRDRFTAPLQPLDFQRDVEGARDTINVWVSDQTRERIRDIVPLGALTADTRLALANAIYLRAPWADPFDKKLTRDEDFWVNGNQRVAVPTMQQKLPCGYAKRAGFAVLTLPYAGRDLHFVILLPDARDGLTKLERALTAEMLAECARLPAREVMLHLPKFTLEPPTIELAEAFQSLGMKSAFDQPPGSANFDRMAPRRPDDYLAIDAILHKAWLKLDEEGTEAAAATVVGMVALSAAIDPPKPVEVRVDRPFVFAIQHARSGVCLFLGRVTNPR